MDSSRDLFGIDVPKSAERKRYQEREDIVFARLLLDRYPELGARDLLHLACCKRRETEKIMTYDRALSAAFDT